MKCDDSLTIIDYVALQSAQNVVFKLSGHLHKQSKEKKSFVNFNQDWFLQICSVPGYFQSSLGCNYEYLNRAETHKLKELLLLINDNVNAND